MSDDAPSGAAAHADGASPTAEPVFRHLDEMKWQQVRTQQHPDGQKSVWEKWFALGRDPQYLSMYARWDPGMIVHRHGHFSPQVVYVLAGEMMCGDVHCPAGTHIELPHGAALGPLVAGPDGVELFEVMMGDPRSWAADPEGYQRFLADRDVVQLPDPPIDLPDWLEDRRSS
jgi:hypothetical protein